MQSRTLRAGFAGAFGILDSIFRRGAVPTSVLEAQVDKAAPGGSARTASLHPKAATNPTRVQGGLAEGVIHLFCVRGERQWRITLR
ncbi:hypothetical protein DAA51_08485 [Bradyrhizobium sp. WBAH10]|nr:hypothetical protein DAA51_08485 [Bradyrhizobium sp. WBAH10]QCJ96099.1 hypothetical protein DAA61_09485 [Bradyrhizobium sp. WBAH33]QCK03469.1 hypothetical protein DAB18_09520 [Bradyrhizobium sp. WBAH41]